MAVTPRYTTPVFFTDTAGNKMNDEEYIINGRQPLPRRPLQLLPTAEEAAALLPAAADKPPAADDAASASPPLHRKRGGSEEDGRNSLRDAASGAKKTETVTPMKLSSEDEHEDVGGTVVDTSLRGSNVRFGFEMAKRQRTVPMRHMLHFGGGRYCGGFERDCGLMDIADYRLRCYAHPPFFVPKNPSPHVPVPEAERVFKAVKDNNLKEIKRWVKQYSGYINNPLFESSLPLLGMAASRGQLPTVRWLVKHCGADTLARGRSNGDTPLHAAVSAGQFDCVKWLVTKGGASVHARNHSTFSPVLTAIMKNDMPMVRWLIEVGDAHINTATETGWTLLHETAQRNDVGMTRWLASRPGADTNAADTLGFTVLHAACRKGNIEVIRYLLSEANALPNSHTHMGMTPLHLCVLHSHWEAARVLITEFDVKLEEVDKSGSTLLHLTLKSRGIDFLRWLVLTLGVDVNIGARLGKPCLHAAITYPAPSDRIRAMSWLISRGADPTAANSQAETAVHIAAREGDIRVLLWLLFLDEGKRTLLTQAAAAAAADDAEEGDGVEGGRRRRPRRAHRILTPPHDADAADVSHVNVNWDLDAPCKPKGDSPLHLCCKL